MSDAAADPTTPPAAPAPPGRRLWRFAREIVVFGLLLLFASTVFGRLRAPDLPDEAPAFTLPDLQGAPVSLASFRGQTVVLNFWATWCGPCRVEIPAFSRFARAHPEIPVLGIAVDGKPAALARAAEELGIDYRVLVGDPATVRAYGASTVPTTVVVGPDGQVKATHVGVMLDPQIWFAVR